MTPLEQLEFWVTGNNVHNTERDECCPDFGCCQPNNHFSPQLRAKFLATYRESGVEACFPMLIMALSGAAADCGVSVHVAHAP